MLAIEQHHHYKTFAEAIEYLSNNWSAQPSLAELAQHVGLSESHMQRLFTQWVGVSPKQFLMFLTQNYAKSQLKKTSVLNAALNSGLSSASRLYDLMISIDGITPGQYKAQGEGVEINYGIHKTPFSLCLIAITKKGICKLAFYDDLNESDAYVQELLLDWPNASIKKEQQETKLVIEQIFQERATNEIKPMKSGNNKPLRLYLKGSSFQLKVWQALLSIPVGGLCSYQQLADSMGASSSVRVVASAIAKNNIAYLIPCHRVIKSTGEFNAYRWGAIRKKVMIAKEAALYGREPHN